MRKESELIFNCIICKEDRDYYSFGSCEHKGVCNFCSMRSRILYKDIKCPICTTKLEEVYIAEISESTDFAQMEKNKEDMYPDEDVKENGIYYSTMGSKEEALKLKNFACPIKNCQDGVFDNLQTLMTHLTKVHKRFYW